MKIKVGIFAIMLFLSLLISHSRFAIASLLSIFIHECGHVLAAKLLKIDMRECKIDIFGASLTPNNSNFSYWDEILLCLCGPAINIVTGLLTFPFLVRISDNFPTYFFLASLALALLNLIPIKGFDGGQILSALLSIIFNVTISEQIMTVISFISIFLLWIISVYFLIIAKSNLSLFIFSISMFVKIFIDEN